MSYIDLHATLKDWPYDAEQISVRKILGSDGVMRIQMRVELGVLQMEIQGRPDAAEPFDCPSLLDFHRKRLDRFEDRHGSTHDYQMTAIQCQALRDEASLYYRRYVASFVLEEFENVVEDTTHTLAIFDLCRDHAGDQEDQACLESFRPYVIMMRARALAYQALNDGEVVSALAHVNRGVMQIQSLYEEIGNFEACETSEEIRMLRSLAADINKDMPDDSLLSKRKALREAIEKEHFEEAARLRDSLESQHGERA